jgi:hypothetical protein
VQGAGIGSSAASNGVVGSLTILDGDITAKATSGGAAIGSGRSQNSQTVTSVSIHNGSFNLDTAGGAGIGAGYAASGSSASIGAVDITGGTFTIKVTNAAGIGSGDSASSTIISYVNTVTISGGTFTITGTTGAGIGAGSSSTGAGKVETLAISGGVFGIKQSTGVAIGAGTGTCAVGTASLGGWIPTAGIPLAISGGVFVAECTTGPAIGASATGVAQLTITGGDFDLKVTSGTLPVIGFHRRDASDTGQQMSVSISGATLVAHGATFLGAADSDLLPAVTFGGVVRVTFTRPAVSYPASPAQAAVFTVEKMVTVESTAYLVAVTPVRFFDKGLTTNIWVTTGRLALIYTGSIDTGADSGFPHGQISFSTGGYYTPVSLFDDGERIDLTLAWASGTHEVTFDFFSGAKMVLSGTSSGSYTLRYYVHRTGESGTLCGGTQCAWTAGDGIVSISVDSKGTTKLNPTKSPTAAPTTLSPPPTVHVETEEFTPALLQYQLRRVFRWLSVFVVGLPA